MLLTDNTRVPGSGTGESGTPGTWFPEVVPKENVAEVIMVSPLMPDPEIVKVTDWLRNG
jgi:hypothetical protein